MPASDYIKAGAELGNMALNGVGTYLDWKERKRLQRQQQLDSTRENNLAKMENMIRLADRNKANSQADVSAAQGAGNYAMNYLDWKKQNQGVF